jgi:putative ABC transport system permease protein
LFQIVGVVADVKETGLDQPPKEEMYFSYWQAQGNYMVPATLVIRTDGDPATLVSAMRQAVWSVDASLPISDVTTTHELLDRELEPRRVQTVLLGTLGALALTLACVGLYGVMAYLVAQQNHEIGIRLALGARRADVLNLILGRGVKLAMTGGVIGIIVALLSTRLMRSLLFDVSPFDPVTFASVAVLLTFVALAASYISARRAMRIDPMVALRTE